MKRTQHNSGRNSHTVANGNHHEFEYQALQGAILSATRMEVIVKVLPDEVSLRMPPRGTYADFLLAKQAIKGNPIVGQKRVTMFIEL
jgi:hypothetical protein